MKLDDLIHHTGELLKGTGPHSNIVMSSRIRLARNLDKTSFPNRANKRSLEQSLEVMQGAIGKVDFFKDSTTFKINELDSLDKQFLIERHLMSH